MNTLEKILQEIEEEALHNPEIGRKQCEGMVRAMNIIKNHLSNSNDWIPIEDTSEIPDGEVICCDEYEQILVGYLSKTDWGEYICESDECTMYDVIAWMPKMKPYRKDGK